MPTGLRAEITEFALAAGASKVGFADMTTLPADVREGLPVAVSVAVALNPEIIAGITDGPTLDYSGEYERVNALLDEIATKLVGFLEERGYRGAFTPAIGAKIDVPTLSTVLPHKTAATLAGMGWIGKCALLVTEEYGSAVRLAAVLTDAPLPTSKPITESLCGECTICTDICPASAPKGNKWQPGTERSDIYDAFACYKTARQLSSEIGISHSICGKCIAECPWTKGYLGRESCG